MKTRKLEWKFDAASEILDLIKDLCWLKTCLFISKTGFHDCVMTMLFCVSSSLFILRMVNILKFSVHINVLNYIFKPISVILQCL